MSDEAKGAIGAALARLGWALVGEGDTAHCVDTRSGAVRVSRAWGPDWRDRGAWTYFHDQSRVFETPEACVLWVDAGCPVTPPAAQPTYPAPRRFEPRANLIDAIEGPLLARIAALEAERDETLAALRDLPISKAPDLDTPAARIRYATSAWRSEREEGSHLATLAQDAHDALDALGVMEVGTVAARIKALRADGAIQAWRTEDEVLALLRAYEGSTVERVQAVLAELATERAGAREDARRLAIVRLAVAR